MLTIQLKLDLINLLEKELNSEDILTKMSAKATGIEFLMTKGFSAQDAANIVDTLLNYIGNDEEIKQKLKLIEEIAWRFFEKGYNVTNESNGTNRDSLRVIFKEHWNQLLTDPLSM